MFENQYLSGQFPNKFIAVENAGYIGISVNLYTYAFYVQTVHHIYIKIQQEINVICTTLQNPLVDQHNQLKAGALTMLLPIQSKR
ncbi:hypothetical protein [Anaerocolumna jejuensis]|uniref:hypothetical protein n=1 Tax=Anaerocolumna jejuensis TaxID=259063 RepID=UPI003F7C6986